MRAAIAGAFVFVGAMLTVMASAPPADSALRAAALPDRAGPDAIYPQTETGAPNPDISQGNIAENICSKAWSTDEVRPSTSVTTPIKRAKMKTYGYTDTGLHYELDHLISLQVAGCPACEENLWPEPYGDAQHHMTESQRASWNRAHAGSTAILPGSLEKDEVENYVHDEVCFGIPNAKMTSAKSRAATVSIRLQRGQEILATDWYACFLKMNNHEPCQ